jgi:hypothetical protein
MACGNDQRPGGKPPAPEGRAAGREQGRPAAAARALAALEAASACGDASPGDRMVTAAAIRDMAGSAAGALAAAAVLAPAPARPALAEATGLAASAATSAGLAWRELGRLREPAAGAGPVSSPGQAAAAAQAAAGAMAALESGLADDSRTAARPAPAAFPGILAVLGETLVRLARACDQLGQDAARACPAAGTHLAQAASCLRAAAIEASPGPAPACAAGPRGAALPADCQPAPVLAC